MYDTVTTIPGLGEFTCYEVKDAAYFNYPALNVTCDVLSQVAQESCCRESHMYCEVCGPNAYMTPDYNNMSVTLPNMEMRTCQDVYMASYIDGNINQETCSAVSALVNKTCCRDSFSTPHVLCNICGIGKNITNPSGNITLYDGTYFGTCSQIGNSAGLGNYNEFDCAYLQLLAVDKCCGGNSSGKTTRSFRTQPNSSRPPQAVMASDSEALAISSTASSNASCFKFVPSVVVTVGTLLWLVG